MFTNLAIPTCVNPVNHMAAEVLQIDGAQMNHAHFFSLRANRFISGYLSFSWLRLRPCHIPS